MNVFEVRRNSLLLERSSEAFTAILIILGKFSVDQSFLNYINPQATLPKATTIITKPGCPYCAKAKKLLTKNNISYDEVSIGKQNTMRSVRALTGQNTVPQIFIEGVLIGDSAALEDHLLIKTAA
ncbi:MAG: glutaredoxin domain-containing protein [bacterium]